MKQELPLAAVPDTFCVYPSTFLFIEASGTTKPCCRFVEAPAAACGLAPGAPATILTHTLEQLWNSTKMRATRRAMVAGERLRECQDCYHEETAGFFSMRQYVNQSWEAGWLNDERAPLGALVARAAADDNRIAPGPVAVHFDVSNLCNLKCRMCTGYNSSRIARDPVHSQWSDTWGPASSLGVPWYRNDQFVLKDFLRNAASIRYLSILGGEPLLVKQVGDLLQVLIDAGAAPHTTLAVTTNGTTTHCPWLKLVPHFKALELTVSLDGYGPYYEYVRYPARWADVARNLQTFKELPNATVGVPVLLQAYSLLNFLELFRYLDGIGVGFAMFTLTWPNYLTVEVMPPRARRLAVERLRTYAATDCRPDYREVVRNLITGLESHGDRFDPERLREFMLFTNDLDVSRGQSFRETHAELLELIEETGFAWTDETRHAGRRPLVLASS